MSSVPRRILTHPTALAILPAEAGRACGRSGKVATANHAVLAAQGLPHWAAPL